MEEKFWHERWALNEIGFHRDNDHPELVKHFSKLESSEGEAIFVPLCGKSRDLLFLARQGLNVVGVELSPLAIDCFFQENDLDEVRAEHPRLTARQAGAITIYQNNFYDLQPEDLEGARLVYDRAALIALPEEMRSGYAARLSELLPSKGRMLLVTNSYDPTEMDGPPFSVTPEEVEQLYAAAFTISRLADFEAIDMHPGLRERGLSSFKTHTFLLVRD